MVDRDKDVDDKMVYEGIRSELSDFETFVEFIVAYVVNIHNPNVV